MDYLVYQEEETKVGGRHLQGYVHFGTKVAFRTAKKRLGYDHAHLEQARGSPAEASAYCKKEESRVAGGAAFEGGVLPVQGKRSDIINLKRKIDEGATYEECLEDEEVVEAAAKYPGFVRDLRSHLDTKEGVKRLKARHNAVMLRPWQKEMLGWLDVEPDDRKVYFVQDTVGGQGKSWFSRFLMVNKGASIFTPGRISDLARIWAKKQSRIVVMDMPRSASGAEMELAYSFIEGVKDGIIQSPKYDSQIVLSDDAHVIIFSNGAPDLHRLSADRWVVFKLVEGELEFVDV